MPTIQTSAHCFIFILVRDAIYRSLQQHQPEPNDGGRSSHQRKGRRIEKYLRAYTTDVDAALVRYRLQRHQSHSQQNPFSRVFSRS